MFFAYGSQNIFVVDILLQHPGQARTARCLSAHLPFGSISASQVGLLACAGVFLLACPAQAQSTATATEPTLIKGPPAPPAASVLSYWSALVRNTVQDALAPVYASVKDFVHPANAVRAWSVPTDAERSNPYALPYPQDFAPASVSEATSTSNFALQRSALPSSDAGVGTWLGPLRFRIPWLVAPDSVMHAMPTLSLAAYGSVHVDLMAASIGGRGGSSAAYGQLVYRF